MKHQLLKQFKVVTDMEGNSEQIKINETTGKQYNPCLDDETFWSILIARKHLIQKRFKFTYDVPLWCILYCAIYINQYKWI